MKMKRHIGMDFVQNLLRRGLYTFSRKDACQSLNRFGTALNAILKRLEVAGWIMPVDESFFSVIDSQHQTLGFAPPEYFLDNWARHHGVEYYVAGVSAAALHGAAHQRPQVYQVVTNHIFRPLRRKSLHIEFFRKKTVSQIMWEQKKSPAGYFRVSTPEFTAYDLLFLPRACPSFDRVATIFVELGEVMNEKNLAALCKKGCETVPLQRLGWLLDHTGWEKLTANLFKKLRQRRMVWRSLVPRLPIQGQRNARWHIIENTQIEPDI